MKIAILYDSKYGNTKELAKFLGEEVQAGGHEIQLFRTTENKPADIIQFQPSAILVGGPTHFGKPALKLRKYIKKLGKTKGKTTINKAAVFSCYNIKDTCQIIQKQLSDAFPKIEILDKTLPIRTGDETGQNWNKVILQENWKEEASNFISTFLTFLV